MELEWLFGNDLLFVWLPIAFVAIIMGYYGYKLVKKEDKSFEMTKSEKISLVLLLVFILIFIILLYYMPVLV